MISVAMTTYNGERYVEKQVRTLLEQTLVPDEIIICDDGSTDATIRILERLAGENSCISLHKNTKNLGYRRNFKQAVSLTRGEYVFLCDQDDEWYPEKLEVMVRIMKEKGLKALCCDFRLIGPDSEPVEKSTFYIHPFIRKAKEESLSPIRFGNLVYGNILQGCTCCFTEEVREKYLQLSNTDVDHDHQIMFVAALLGDVCFYKHPLIGYRIHTGNAIGLTAKTEETGIELKKPSSKPFMVQFLEELDRVIPVPRLAWYKSLFYLRIPYFVSALRK